MNATRGLFDALLLVTLLGCLSCGLSACAPKVGSDQWCDKISHKSESDKTAKEQEIYASQCFDRQLKLN